MTYCFSVKVNHVSYALEERMRANTLKKGFSTYSLIVVREIGS